MSRATEPIDVAILVDNSAVGKRRHHVPSKGAVEVRGQDGAGQRVAVIALADRPTILVDYTDDTKRLSDAVGRLFAMSQSGMTLLDGIFETSRGLRIAKRPAPSSFRCSPTGSNSPTATRRTSSTPCRSEDVALHMVTIGQFYHSEEHATRERSFLLDAGPRGSGGQRISLLSPHGLEDALQRLARELSSQYKVVYGRPQSLITPERAEVSSTRAGVTMRGARARGESGA